MRNPARRKCSVIPSSYRSITKGGREVEERAVDAVVGSDELVKRSRISQCFNACALTAEVVSRVFPTDKGIDEMVRL
jgi:hypothetical protein